MNRIDKTIKYLVGGMLAGLLMANLSSCTDDFPVEQSLIPESGKPGRMVELTLPFRLQQPTQVDVTTRGTTDTDNQLSRILVFVYENKPNVQSMRDNKRLAYYEFVNKSSEEDLDNNVGGWIPGKDEAGNDDHTKGTVKIHVPTGPCYIYLMGNVMGSFLNFFPDLEPNQPTGLDDLQAFWDAGNPKWTGNMDKVDGYLPMIGTVNNASGACEVYLDDTQKVMLRYEDRNGEIVEFDPNFSEGPNAPDADLISPDSTSFLLRRMMSKVTVHVNGGEGVKFIPKDYRFCQIAQHVAPTESARKSDLSLTSRVVDTEVVPFSAQSPNSFTVYLPECISAPKTMRIQDFSAREAIVKENGQNLMEGPDEYDPNAGSHYQFLNAPDNAPFLEITGRFEGTRDGQPISADTKYYIHLGDFGPDKGYDDFNLKRDCHYTYNITVKGVDKIYVEVTTSNDETDGNTQDAPGAEGVLFEGGARVTLDAHYEQVEMKLDKVQLNQGIYIHAQTPFGKVNCKYLPMEQKLDETYHNEPAELDKAKRLLQWVQFKRQNAKGTLATYGTDVKNVFDALNEAYASEGTPYYTCFVDEYYYTQDPLNDRRIVDLSEFVNAEDRSFSLGSSIQYSEDGKSAIAKAVYVLQQHSIACFYDLANTTVAKYGVEIIDEIGDLAESPLPYGNPRTEGSHPKDGRANTLNEVSGITGAVNWEKNGFLLNDNDDKLEPSPDRLNNGSKYGYLACLTRNRDLDGNGQITENELRWYTPARDQMLGLWIGEPALPAQAALYPFPTDQLKHLGSRSNHPIYTSTNGSNRVIWAEEGCSFGGVDSSGGATNGEGYVRVVRNLGQTASSDSHTTTPQPYYSYNQTDRTIEVYLTSNALRGFSYRELAPHHERSAINRPYRKFQVAKEPYTKQATATCDGHGLASQATRSYKQLQTSSVVEAKTGQNTKAMEYVESGNNITTANWRLPNQRELALMIVAMGNEMDYNMNDANYHHMNYECNGGLLSHNWTYTNNYVIHCRTSFSNTNYTKYGYMYNTDQRDGKKIQMLWLASEGKDLGQGEDGQGGYLCVRDVQ